MKVSYFLPGADGSKIDHITMRYEWLLLGDNLDPSNTTSWSAQTFCFFPSACEPLKLKGAGPEEVRQGQKVTN